MSPFKAGDLISRKVIAVGPLEPVSKVIGLFQEKRISALPVVDEDQKLLGIITKADVIAHTLSWGSQVISDAQASQDPAPACEQSERSGALVRDVMNPVLVTQSCEASPAELARIMRENEIHHVPITDQGKLAGIVSSFDLLRLLCKSD